MIIKADVSIFPEEVKVLLQGLAAENFFADGILCGSWVLKPCFCTNSSLRKEGKPHLRQRRIWSSVHP